MGVNFFDYVNGFRVGEAKRLLLDPSKSAFTILAVAEEAGFTSKSAFNTAFKKYGPVSPRQTGRSFRPPATRLNIPDDDRHIQAGARQEPTRLGGNPDRFSNRPVPLPPWR